MSEYVPTEWKCGDILTAEALNKIEQGIANADCGGGGSSDFSTAEVTVRCDGELASIFIIGSFLDIERETLIPTMRFSQLDNPTITTMALYKGGAIAYITDNYNSISLTGDATDLGDGGISITGDCTITIS